MFICKKKTPSVSLRSLWSYSARVQVCWWWKTVYRLQTSHCDQSVLYKVCTFQDLPESLLLCERMRAERSRVIMLSRSTCCANTNPNHHLYFLNHIGHVLAELKRRKNTRTSESILKPQKPFEAGTNRVSEKTKENVFSLISFTVDALASSSNSHMRQIIFLAQLDLYRALPWHERGRMPGVPRQCSMSLSSAPGFRICWFMGSPLHFSSLLMIEAEGSCQKCIFRAPESVKEIYTTAPSNSALWVVMFIES